MYRISKFIHLIGLTLFLGSIWVYIAEGTPIHSALITHYVRMNIVTMMTTLTFPGLILMILSGITMALLRPVLLRSVFFKVKLITTFLLLMNARHIFHIAKKSSMLALPENMPTLKILLTQGSLWGAINVITILFLILYSVFAKKFKVKNS